MTSGPIVEIVLVYENCVEYTREIIGATEPARAVPGTTRKRFADSLAMHAVHESDSPHNADREKAFMFGVPFV